MITQWTGVYMNPKEMCEDVGSLSKGKMQRKELCLLGITWIFGTNYSKYDLISI